MPANRRPLLWPFALATTVFIFACLLATSASAHLRGHAHGHRLSAHLRGHAHGHRLSAHLRGHAHGHRLSAHLRGHAHGHRLSAHLRGHAQNHRPAARFRDALSHQMIRPHRRVLWGATIGSQLTGLEEPEDMNTVSAFTRLTGKAPSIVHFYEPWEQCPSWNSCSNLGFPHVYAEQIRRGGSIPMITWLSEATDSSEWDPRFNLASIVDGRWDSEIYAFAEGSKRWHHPYFLRFDAEMNGNWHSWDDQDLGNTPALFRAAWRHVWNIFHAVGAHNATWVWCPNVGWFGDERADYPGNRYVDWTCLDGYNWGLDPSPDNPIHQWLSFSQVFGASYHYLLHIAPRKPVMIGEFASSSYGGDKAAWVANALSVIPRQFPRVHAALYFDRDTDSNWDLEADPTVARSFARAIHSPLYASAGYGSVSRVPVP